MRETHACGKLRGILPAVRKNNQFAPARILRADFTEQYVRKNLRQLLEAGPLRPDWRSDVPARPICIAPWTTGRICLPRTCSQPLRTGIKDVPIRPMHLCDAIRKTAPRLRVPAQRDSGIRRNK